MDAHEGPAGEYPVGGAYPAEDHATTMSPEDIAHANRDRDLLVAANVWAETIRSRRWTDAARALDTLARVLGVEMHTRPARESEHGNHGGDLRYGPGEHSVIPPNNTRDVFMTAEQIRYLAAHVATVEREGCAKIAIDAAEDPSYWPEASRFRARTIAATIRARK